MTGTVTPLLQPTTLSTGLSGASGQDGTQLVVAPGTGVRDQATLSGTNAGLAGGTVTYSVYSDPDCSVAAAPPDTVTLGGGAISASAPVVLAKGTYWWVASYSGDAANAASQSTCGSETAIVLSASNAGADVAARLHIERGATMDLGSAFEIDVTVTNYGPTRAKNIVTGLRVPRVLSVDDPDGAVRFRGLLVWRPRTVASGHAITYRLSVSTSPNATRTTTIDAGALSPGKRDPDFHNNFAADQLTFTRVDGTRKPGVRRVRFSDRRLRSGLRVAGQALHQWR